MDKLNQLLQDVSKIVVEEKTLQEEKRKRGDNFNVFSVLGLQTSEVRLHSALIAELLSPDGGHGLGDKFIKAFLDVLNKHYEEPFCFDTESAKVIVEHNIGSISENYESGGRIDLFIQDKNSQTIIIENKIYAGDQYRQMFRYYEYAKEELKLKDDQVKLLYLTLDRDDPSDDSLGNSNVKYTSISYRDEILDWLNRGIEISALFPIVRETIRQYITTLNNILSIMGNENNDKMIETLLASENNLSTALAIMNSGLKKRLIDDFVEKLRNLANEESMEFKAIPVFSDLAPAKYATVSFWLKDYPRARFSLQQDQKMVYYGIDTTGNPKEITQKQLYGDCLPCANWPFGYSYFQDNFSIWDSTETLLDIKFGHVIYDCIKKELEKAKEHLKELHKALEQSIS